MVESIVLSGVAIGCIYALIGITYNVMFSASRVFSFTAGTLGMLGGTLFAATMTSFAYFAKKFGDGTLVHQDPRTIVWIPVALVGLFVLRGIGEFVQTYFMGYVGRHIVSRLRREIFRHSLQLPVGYFDRNPSAALLSRLTYNAELVGVAATDSINLVAEPTQMIRTPEASGSRVPA